MFKNNTTRQLPLGILRRYISMKQLLKLRATVVSIFDELGDNITVIEAKKNTRLLSFGQNQDSIYYVKEGVVRSYSFVDDREWTNWFFGKDDFALSIESFVMGGASLDNLETCSKTVLIGIKKTDFNSLYENSPAIRQELNNLTRIFFLLGRERLRTLCLDGSFDRYKKFRETHSYINERINRNHLASYLGMTNECLSRIERKYENIIHN